MVKLTTFYGRYGIPDSVKDMHKNNASYSKPCEKEIRFIIDYAKYIVL